MRHSYTHSALGLIHLSSLITLKFIKPPHPSSKNHQHKEGGKGFMYDTWWEKKIVFDMWKATKGHICKFNLNFVKVSA